MMKKLLISLALGLASALSAADDFGVERVSCAACMMPAGNTKAPTPVKIDAPKPTKPAVENSQKAPNAALPANTAPQPSLLPSLASKMALSGDAVEPQAVKTAAKTTVKKPAQATAQKPKAASKPAPVSKPKTVAAKAPKAVTVAKPATVTKPAAKVAAKPQTVKKAVPNPAAVAQQATQPKPAIKQPNVAQPKPQAASAQPNTPENKILSLGEGLVK